MGHRISSLILGLVCSIAMSNVFSLGLGDVSLKSNLNQPLKAEISLLEVRELSDREIIIKLASPADFDRLDVDRHYFLTDFKFSVDLKSSGDPVVLVTSSRPIREPFVNFLIEVQWPSGKLLREYTLLLDLPVFSDEAALPVNPVQTQTVQGQSSSSRSNLALPNTGTRANPRSGSGARTQQDSERTTSSFSTSPRYSGESYDVKASDTLWEIALDVRPGSDVSVHQTMLALQKANPGAFINGNINLLKAGQILKIPNRDEIQGLNQRQAVKEVASQNAVWSGDVEAAPLEASRKSLSSYDDAEESEGRLSLSSPKDNSSVSQGRISGADDNAVAKLGELEAELNASQETLDSAQSENRELKGKISSLEEQIQTLESMISISSDSLRALELQAAESSVEQNQEQDESLGLNVDITEPTLDALELEETGEVAVEPIDSEGASSELDLSFDEDVVAVADEVVEPIAEESPEATPTAQPVKVVQPIPVASTSIMDLVFEYGIYIAIVLVLIIVALVVYLRQRGFEEDDEFDEYLDEGQPQFDEAYDDAELDEGAYPDDLAELEDLNGGDAEDSKTELNDTEAEDDVEPQTEDVVAESDIYIAYGKYDQAEDMLQKTLSSNPDHHDARVKLLEIYAAQDNIESFDPVYAELRSSSASDMHIERAAALRETVANADAFDSSAFGYANEDDSLDESFDLDVAVSPILEQAAETPIDDDLSVDGALGLDSSFGLADDLTDQAGSDELEFDLDIDDLDSDVDSPLADISTLSEEKGVSEELDLTDNTDEEIDLEFDLESEDLDEFDLDLGDLDTSSKLGDTPNEDLQLGDDMLDLELGDLDEVSLDSTALDLPSSDDDLSIELGELQVDGEDLLTESVDFSLSDDLEQGLEELAIDIEAPIEGVDSELELGDDLELDLSDAEPDSAESELDNLDALELDLGGLDTNAAPELTQVDGSDDDTLIRPSPVFDSIERDAPMLESAKDNREVDDLSLTGTNFDIAALDQELEALTSDLDSSALDNMSSEFSEENIDLESDLESELPELDTFEDLDVDAELGDEPLLAETSASVDEPDLDFESFELEDGSDTAEASGDTELDFELPELEQADDSDDDLNFLSGSDETATKLDLASAYIDMGDMLGAKDILEEILREGTDEQKSQANTLLDRLND